MLDRRRYQRPAPAMPGPIRRPARARRRRPRAVARMHPAPPVDRPRRGGGRGTGGGGDRAADAAASEAPPVAQATVTHPIAVEDHPVTGAHDALEALEGSLPSSEAERPIISTAQLLERRARRCEQRCRVSTPHPAEDGRRRLPSPEHGRDREVVPKIVHELMYHPRGFLETEAPPSGRAQHPERDGRAPSGHRALVGGVGEGEPGRVVVLREVEPVASHRGARQQPAGEVAAGHPDDAGGGEKVELHLRRRARRPRAANGLERVRVAVGELERRCSLASYLRKRPSRPSHR